MLSKKQQARSTEPPHSNIEMELDLCTLLSEQHAKNYYAWIHRLWAVKWSRELNQYQRNAQSINLFVRLLVSELVFTQSWLAGHVSDHSAVNHRCQIIQLIIEECLNERKNSTLEESKISVASLLQSELQSLFPRDFQESSEFDIPFPRQSIELQVVFSNLFQMNKSLIQLRTGFEALWCDRRNLFGIFLQSLQVCCDLEGKDEGGPIDAITLHFDWFSASKILRVHNLNDSEPGRVSETSPGALLGYLSRVLLIEVNFMSRWAMDESDYAMLAPEDRRQRIFSLRCFAHLLSLALNVLAKESNGNVFVRVLAVSLEDVAEHLKIYDSINSNFYSYLSKYCKQ